MFIKIIYMVLFLQELENTITSLKSQVQSLQQRLLLNNNNNANNNITGVTPSQQGSELRDMIGRSQLFQHQQRHVISSLEDEEFKDARLSPTDSIESLSLVL